MKYQIKDFCDLYAVEVKPMLSRDEPLVLITQSAGSIRFQHTMRPEQARYMAAALQMAAEESEKPQPADLVQIGGEA